MLSYKDENVYQTSDFAEAITLKYFSHQIKFVDRSEKRAVFHFFRKDNTQEVLSAFRERGLKVEPFAFYQCEREVKSRLYNG